MRYLITKNTPRRPAAIISTLFVPVLLLGRAGHLKASELQERYDQELQPKVVGCAWWHDQTMQMRIAAFLTPAAPQRQVICAGQGALVVEYNACWV